MDLPSYKASQNQYVRVAVNYFYHIKKTMQMQKKWKAFFFPPRTNTLLAFYWLSLYQAQKEKTQYDPKTSICFSPFWSNMLCVFFSTTICVSKSQQQCSAGQGGSKAGTGWRCKRRGALHLEAFLRPHTTLAGPKTEPRPTMHPWEGRQDFREWLLSHQHPSSLAHTWHRQKWPWPASRTAATSLSHQQIPGHVPRFSAFATQGTK